MEHKEIMKWIRFACERCGCPELADQITYTFNKRIMCVGRAFPRIRKIEFSAQKWPRLSDSERQNLVVHETCHIIAERQYRSSESSMYKGHGWAWQQCMVKCGLDPLPSVAFHSKSRKYHPEEPRPIGSLVVVLCGCTSKKKVTLAHAERIRQGQKITCDICKTPLRLAYPRKKPFTGPQRPSRTGSSELNKECIGS